MKTNKGYQGANKMKEQKRITKNRLSDYQNSILKMSQDLGWFGAGNFIHLPSGHVLPMPYATYIPDEAKAKIRASAIDLTLDSVITQAKKNNLSYINFTHPYYGWDGKTYRDIYHSWINNFPPLGSYVVFGKDLDSANNAMAELIEGFYLLIDGKREWCNVARLGYSFDKGWLEACATLVYFRFNTLDVIYPNLKKMMTNDGCYGYVTAKKELGKDSE